MTGGVEDLHARLAGRARALADTYLPDLFARDSGRAGRFTYVAGDLLLDLSRTRLDRGALGDLLALAECRGVATRREAMFRGEVVNATERRAALHPGARDPKGGDSDRAGALVAARERMLDFAESVRTGTVGAADGGPFTDIVNLGIGGSHFGPHMLLNALRRWHDGPRVHCLASVDGAALEECTRNLDPARTLVIAASKSFTTAETQANAVALRDWLGSALGTEAARAQMAAVTAAPEKASAWGMLPERIFVFDPAIGGRYSIWSAVGLPVALAVGAKVFRQFLAGGHAMDRHFRAARAALNLPLLLGLSGVWQRSFLRLPARAILPYSHPLAELPTYLQQLEMESNGKSVTETGNAVALPTAPLIWGGPGTESQHSFFQYLHQGTDPSACEFILVLPNAADPYPVHQAMLAANGLAQCEALLRGRDADATRVHLRQRGFAADEAEKQAAQCSFPGGRPSTLILLRRFDPGVLGQLIALYEHRVLVEATVWGINPFDQMGVELGKETAQALMPAMGDAGDRAGLPETVAATLAEWDRFRDTQLPEDNLEFETGTARVTGDSTTAT